MSSEFIPGMDKRPIGPRALALLLAGVTSVIGIVCWLLGREAFLAVLRGSGSREWTVGFWDKAGFILFGFLWLMLVYLSAHYYDKSIEQGRLWRTFLLVLAAEVAFLVLAIGVRFVAIWATLGSPPSLLPF